MESLQAKLGEPDLKLSGLQIWIHNRQCPNDHDYWDGNWLDVTVLCRALNASVWTNGSIIHLSEIAQWLKEVEAMAISLQGEASLSCLEPKLSVTLEAKNFGHISMDVYITPDLSQRHEFTFEIDQSYLPLLIRNCRTILKQYPIKGQP